ncbi:MAG TPA: valine--tRNA ligase [Chitinophagaceae bacterium]|nr:valine--tRNA ligase [Chitinophagaceae bacterium]
MELSKHFDPQAVEHKWYNHWKNKKYFNSKPDDREPFTIVVPPPNVTGVLHMGHTLNATVQDILIRWARMHGYNACWVPGSDHASIATEAKVVAMLKEKGIEKNNLSRAEFLKYAFEWKEKYGNIIYSQMERLGCSVDWERTTFTMDDHYYKAVIKVFIDLYNKGLIYRGARMINWDPQAQTALSDEEVDYKEQQGILYHIKYAIADDEGHATNAYIIIATQRPETIMGDTAVCVNPKDERYTHLKNKQVIIPIVNRLVPIIFDEYVDPAFGTGALKVTPAHDINDYNLSLKHQLPIIDTLNADGTMSSAAEVFVGEDRFVVRKKMVQLLKEQNILVKEETYTTRLGYSQRTGVVVEPRISTQWFVQMKKLTEPALQAVLKENIHIHPKDKFLATYTYWLENVKDWCISRQLWWGQRIPAWYDNNGNFVVTETKEDAIEQFKIQNSKFKIEELKQDEDVLDTWFSSWIWPIEVFKGITEPNNKEINYYYPTSVLVTGQDIIFFWVARMIMAGMEYQKEIPFKDVYFTGMVRDNLGRKMSKQLGNSPDLLKLIDQYGADAVRFGIMISSPAGNDLLFDEAALEQGRNFNNKLWNAFKLVKIWETRQSTNDTAVANDFAMIWFEQRLHEAQIQVQQLFDEYKLSEALKVIYSLIWDDFCSWYLEWIKPSMDKPISTATYNKTIDFFSRLMQLLHPFMPFITEEIYHLLDNRIEDLCIKQFAAIPNIDNSTLQQGELLKQVITAIRDTRNKNQIKPKDPISLYIQTQHIDTYQKIQPIISKQVNADTIEFTQNAMSDSIALVIGKDKLYIQTQNPINTGIQKEALLKELEYTKGFLLSVEKKLSNERFVQNAKPEVIELEQKKKADAVAKIKTLENTLQSL